MTDGMTKGTIDSMRTLTNLIDSSVDALLESHGFTFTQMQAAERQAQALFQGEPAGALPPWQLTVNHAAGGTTTVSLARTVDERPQISLTVLVGPHCVSSLAEAIGLAVSFALMSDQMLSTAPGGEDGTRVSSFG